MTAAFYWEVVKILTKNVLKCLKRVNPGFIAVVSPAESRTGATGWAGAKACSLLCWASQLHSGTFAEVGRVKLNLYLAHKKSSPKMFIGGETFQIFRLLKFGHGAVVAVVRRSVADEVVRRVTKIHP